MLTGDAKRAYQREYMRRKRAGKPTRKPRTAKPWKPTRRIIDAVARLGRLRESGGWISKDGAKVIAGLKLDNDASWMTACRRYCKLTEARQAARQQATQEATAPKPRACMFCGETAASKRNRVFVGDGVSVICEVCIRKTAAIVARTKARER